MIAYLIYCSLKFPYLLFPTSQDKASTSYPRSLSSERIETEPCQLQPHCAGVRVTEKEQSPGGLGCQMLQPPGVSDCTSAGSPPAP